MSQWAQAKDVSKLVKTAIRIMVNDLGAERALVVSESGGQEKPRANAVYGIDDGGIWENPTLPAEVLGFVLRHSKPVYLADARKDNRVKNKESNPSVLCVPITDGLLYCDHSEPGKLTKDTKNALIQVARDYNQRYGELTGKVAERKARAGLEVHSPSNFEIPAQRTSRFNIDARDIVVFMTIVFIVFITVAAGWLINV